MWAVNKRDLARWRKCDKAFFFLPGSSNEVIIMTFLPYRVDITKGLPHANHNHNHKQTVINEVVGLKARPRDTS